MHQFFAALMVSGVPYPWPYPISNFLSLKNNQENNTSESTRIQTGACITRFTILKIRAPAGLSSPPPSSLILKFCRLRFPHPYRLMSAVQHSDYRHHIIYDVASYHVGKSLVDVARNSLTGGKIRSGDHHLDRSRPLIHQFYAGLPNNERNAVHNGYQKAVSARERIESAHGFRKIFMAKEYEEVAKHLFIIVDTAS
ncbi:hypothetical protein EDB85DRAFT_1041370 [Lactarius pseudohatsudake]|nr:hypothetical protein EDB85DRAFT_1041370 [Lactarius pseudohatsudake]